MAPGVIQRPDALDFDIFREMYRSGGVSIAGIDPRLNPSQVAGRLRVSRARVAARLAEWTRTGLLERYDVWPNPALFDRVGFSVDVRLTERSEKAAVVERAALIDGAVGGIEFAGEWVTLQFLAHRPEDAARIALLLRGLSGVSEVLPTIPWRRLEPARALSPLDRRIVRVLRGHPTDPLSEIARRVGVSTRTITTRYGQLVEDLAVWFVPVFDFRALAPPVVAVNAQLTDGAQRPALARAIRRSYPNSLELLSAGFGPELPPDVAVFFVLTPSAAAVDDLEGFVRAAARLRSLELLTLVRVLTFPETFDRLLADGPVGPVRPRPAPRAPARGL